MRWADHEARMGDMRNTYRILVGKLEGRRTPLRRPKRRYERTEFVWTEFVWIIWGPVADACKHSNETSDSTKGSDVLDEVSNYYL
jgi:hypothetical protein